MTMRGPPGPVTRPTAIGAAVPAVPAARGERASVDDAVADLDELIQLNDKRPYFLLMHVREINSVEKVKTIISKLGGGVEIVPLDVFLEMAARQKTYRTRYQQPDDPVSRNATAGF